MTKPQNSGAAAANAVRRDLPLQLRAASLQPASINTEARTIDVIWSTGAAVKRYDWASNRTYSEILSLDPGHVDLSRLNEGAPVLNTHSAWSLNDIIGVVEPGSARVDGTQGTATLRFSGREDLAPLWADIQAGIIRNISVGYSVQEYQIAQRDNGPDEWTAVAWTPMEISFVPIGADAGAGTRNADPAQSLHPCHLIEERSMSKPNSNAHSPADSGVEETRGAPAAQPAQAPAVEAVVADAVRAERERGVHIRAAASALDVPADFVQGLIDKGVSVDTARAELINQHAARAAEQAAVRAARGGVQIGTDHTDPDMISTRMQNALAARMSSSLPQSARIALTDDAREFGYHSILELAADLARARGEKVARNLPPALLYDDLVQRNALTASDFPKLLGGVTNRILLAAWGVGPQTFSAFSAPIEIKDFRQTALLRAGDFPAPLEVNESGEYRVGVIGESKQTMALASYGRIVKLTRQLLINDDIGALAALPKMGGIRIAAWQNSMVYAYLLSNPTMNDDSFALFATGHNNYVSSGTVISIASVGAARQAIMQQATIDSATKDTATGTTQPIYLNMSPSYLVVGPTIQTTAEQFVNVNLFAAKNVDVNPFSGKLTVVTDANITDNRWYAFVDANVHPTLRHGYLQGYTGPRMETQSRWESDGLDMKLAIDFGVGAEDYRGGYLNAGA
jgi:hypothetical protein